MVFHTIYVALSILGFIPAVIFLALFLRGASNTWRKRRTAIAGVVIVGLTLSVTLLLGRNLWLIATSPVEVMTARYEHRDTGDLIFSSVLLFTVNVIMYALLYLYWHVRAHNEEPRT